MGGETFLAKWKSFSFQEGSEAANCKSVCFTKMKNKQWRQCLTLTFQRLFKNPRDAQEKVNNDLDFQLALGILLGMTGFKVFLGYH